MKDFLIGAIASIIIFGPVLYAHVSEPKLDEELFVPYENVLLLEEELINNTLLIRVQFDKLDCEFVYLQTVGFTLGIPERLPWVDINGDAGNREPGTHVIELQIALTNDVVYDYVEIRTRHTCDGETVDRTLLTVDLIE